MTRAEIATQRCIVHCNCGAVVMLRGEPAHDLEKRGAALVLLGWSPERLCPTCSQKCTVHCQCGERIVITGRNAHDLIGRLQHLRNLGWTDRKCPQCAGNAETAAGQLPLLTV